MAVNVGSPQYSWQLALTQYGHAESDRTTKTVSGINMGSEGYDAAFFYEAFKRMVGIGDDVSENQLYVIHSQARIDKAEVVNNG